jgi:anti-anti-sigma factor
MAQKAFTVDTSLSGGTRQIAVGGYFDRRAAPEVRRMLEAADEDHEMVVDLNAVTVIDDSAMGLLLSLWRSRVSQGRQTTFRCSRSPIVMSAFRSRRYEQMLAAVETAR